MKILWTLLVFLTMFYSGLSQQKQAVDSTVKYTRDSLVNLSETLIRSGDLDSAEYIIQFAREYLEPHDDYGGLTQLYGALTYLSQKRGNNAQAIAYTKKAIEYIKKMDHKENLAMSYLHIGAILVADNQYEAALEYMLKGEELLLESESLDYIAFLNTNLSALYILMDKPLEDIWERIDRAEKIARNDSDTLRMITLLNNKGLALVKNEVRIDESIQYFKESLKLQNQTSKLDTYSRGFSYNGLSNACASQNQFKKALIYNDSALSHFMKTYYPYGLRQVYETRESVLLGLKDYEGAYEALDMLKLYLDTLHDEQRTQQINRVRTEYETERKEAQIESLSQQASIQELRIKQKNQLILMGSVIVLVIFLVIYIVYKNKNQRREKSRFELEQRFLRSQLNPHFMSNALLAIQNFILKKDTNEAASYLAKFSKLMREILENSRQEFITVDREVEMLKNFLDIHRLRLNNSFEYTIVTDETIAPELDTIPPMFIQPFVENAIEHGLSNHQSTGKIDLQLRKEGEYIVVTLKDNGGGFQEMNNSEGNRSLSTKIIRERMSLFNRSLKNKIHFYISNLKEENGTILGAMIELRIPFDKT